MSRNLPRSNTVKPFEGFPAYGVVHDVMPNDRLRGFLYDFSRISDYVFMRSLGGVVPEPIEDFMVDDPFAIDPDLKSRIEEGYDSRRYYRIFDTETLGVSVVEMDPSERAAKLARTVFESQDFGAVKQEACDEIGRTMPNIHPHLFFDRVDGVGGRLPAVVQTDVRRKLALMPNSLRYPETLDLITNEAAIFIDALKRRIKQFTYPWDVVPHLTYAVFRHAATPEQVAVVAESTNNYLSAIDENGKNSAFGVRLGNLGFRYKTTR